MTASEPPERWLLVYFVGEEEGGEAIRFARSLGSEVEWEVLADGRPILVSSVGTRGARDPFLLRSQGLPGESARFYLLATDLRIAGGGPAAWKDAVTAGSRSILLWTSDDLLEWSGPELVAVAPVGAGNAWAPEAVFDAKAGDYMLYWASSVGHHGTNQMWTCRTRDFRSFTQPVQWTTGSRAVIDATLVQDDAGGWWRFAKDETDARDAKFVTVESAPELSGPWRLRERGIGSAEAGMAHSEGPIVFRTEHRWVMFLDEYGLRGYLPFAAGDLAGPWLPIPGSSLPSSSRHGTVLSISDREWHRLGERFGTAGRSTRDEGATQRRGRTHADPSLFPPRNCSRIRGEDRHRRRDRRCRHTSRERNR